MNPQGGCDHLAKETAPRQMTSHIRSSRLERSKYEVCLPGHPSEFLTKPFAGARFLCFGQIERDRVMKQNRAARSGKGRDCSESPDIEAGMSNRQVPRLRTEMGGQLSGIGSTWPTSHGKAQGGGLGPCAERPCPAANGVENARRRHLADGESGKACPVKQQGRPADPGQPEDWPIECQDIVEPGPFYPVYTCRRTAAGSCNGAANVENKCPSRYSAAFRMA